MALKPFILFFFMFLIVAGILPLTCDGSIYRIPRSGPPLTPPPPTPISTSTSTVSISNKKKMTRAKANYGKTGGHLISSSSALNVKTLPRVMRVPPSGPSKRHNSVEGANSP